MENKNLTDWISAISNFAMAVAAVYAAFNAKRWFSQRSHTIGFDKAEDILAQIDTLFHKTSEGIYKLHNTLEVLEPVSTRSALIDGAEMDKFENHADHHNQIIKSIDRLLEEIELIERWSIKIKNEVLIKRTIKAIRDNHVSATNAYHTARNAIYNLNYIGLDEFENMYKHFKMLYGEYLGEIAVVEFEYSEFKKQKFTSYFKVQ